MQTSSLNPPASLSAWLEQTRKLVQAAATNKQDLQVLALGQAEQMVDAWPEQYPLLLACMQFYPKGFTPAVHWVLRCAILTTAIGYELRWHPAVVQQLVCSALTMDISIHPLLNQYLNKRTLDIEQKKQWLRHPLTSMQWLMQSGVNNKLWLRQVLHHHERRDGQGYPGHLLGSRVCDAAQILNLVGECVRLSIPREKSTPPTLNTVLTRLYWQHFHPRAALRALTRLFMPLPLGSMLRLNDDSLVLSVAPATQDRVLIMPCNAGGSEPSTPTQTINDDDVSKVFPCLVLNQTDILERWQRLIRQLPPHPHNWPSPSITPTPIIEPLRDELHEQYPSMRLIAGILEHSHLCDPLLQAINARRNSRSKPIATIKHGMMLLGLDHAEPLILRTELFYLLAERQYPLLPALLTISRQYMALCHVLTTRTDVYYPEWVETVAAFEAAAVLQAPTWLSCTDTHLRVANNEGPFAALWLNSEQAEKSRKDAVSLARNWRLPQPLCQALASRNGSINMNGTRSVRQIAAVLTLASWLLGMLYDSGQLHACPATIQRTLKTLDIPEHQLTAIVEASLVFNHAFCAL